MIIGCVKEIKTQEYRVGLIPSHVKSFIDHGHTVLIEKGAGQGSGFLDEDYQSMGATLIDLAQDVWQQAQLLIKVKEPLHSEYAYFREDLVLFTYLHLAAEENLTQALIDSKMTSLAYETLEVDGQLPLLKPMSEIAGRLSVQEAAKYLEKPMGGKGLLLGGVPGVPKANVMILGAGVSGSNAAKIAVGMGANVTILDKNLNRLEALDNLYGNEIQTLYSTPGAILNLLPTTDVVIGAVLVAGAKAPQLIKRDDLKRMKPGSILVDIAVDQGGCFETTHATTHTDPVFKVDEIVHYCVANMPGAVPMSSTMALTNATLTYSLMLADYGVHDACKKDKHLISAINTYQGKLSNLAVAQTFNKPYQAFEV